MARQAGGSAAAAKRELRRTLRVRLAALDRDQASSAAAAVAARVLELPEVASARGVLACLSYGLEIDTWGLADALMARGLELYVPRSDAGSGRLHVHRYPCDLVTLPFGLRQPPADAPEIAAEDLPAVLDAVLVVGLAFDRRGYRLGHGAGYFDRFLAEGPAPAIGLAFHLQLLDELPTESHDVPMRAVVTEREVWRPPPRHGSP